MGCCACLAHPWGAVTYNYKAFAVLNRNAEMEVSVEAQGGLCSAASTAVFSRLVWQHLCKAKSNPMLGMAVKDVLGCVGDN